MFCYVLFNPPQPRWPPLRGLKQTLEPPLFNRHAVRVTRGPGSTFESLVSVLLDVSVSVKSWTCRWADVCLFIQTLFAQPITAAICRPRQAVWWMGPRSIFRSTKKAKSHINPVQLTWTEWLMWTYSHFHLLLLPLHQPLLSSLTFNFFKHPFTLLSPFGVSVAPLTSSSTSHWWAGRGHSCWITPVCVCLRVSRPVCCLGSQPADFAISSCKCRC